VPADRTRLLTAGPGQVFTLAAAVGAGPWRPFGRVALLRPRDPMDPRVHFDPVRHAPPGLAADGPIARLREPAYAAARARQSWDAAAEPLEAADTEPGRR
jgi:hypothetical protein